MILYNKIAAVFITSGDKQLKFNSIQQLCAVILKLDFFYNILRLETES